MVCMSEYPSSIPIRGSLFSNTLSVASYGRTDPDFGIVKILSCVPLYSTGSKSCVS